MAYIEHPSALLGGECFLLIVGTVFLTRLGRRLAPRSDRLATIDGLRGVLAICVSFHHFFISYQWKHIGAWKPPPTHLYDLMGSCSVALFFMITGFLFFGKIKAVRGSLNLNAFFVGRLFRICPVYVVSVILVVVSALVKTGPTLDLQASLDQWVFFQTGIVNGYEASSLINAGVQWTLSYEWMFYLSLPAVAYAWSLLRLQSWALLLLSVATLWLTKTSAQIPYIEVSAAFFAPFALGGLVGEMGRSPAVRRLAESAWGTLATLVFAAIVFFFYQSAYSVSGYLMVAALFAPIALGNSLFGVLRTRTFMVLGEISYDIYLLHGIVLFALYSILLPTALERASTPGRLFALLALASGCTLAASLLVHVLVEKPCLRLGKKLVAIDRTQELAAP